MIRILTGIAPDDVHFSRGQINDHGVDGLFAVQRIGPFDGMVTDRVRQVDMILLNCLQGLDGM